MNFLKRWLYKDIHITEYSGITVTDTIHEKVFLEAGRFSIDISTRHWLLCLEPLMFGVWIPKNEIFIQRCDKDITITFRDPDKIIAKANLEVFDMIDSAEGSLVLLRYETGKIMHAGSLETKFLFHRYYKKPGLSFTKFKTLVTGYSYPRRVRIISFIQGDHFNIFPMDLLAPVPGTDHFVFGLRHTNRTLAKIMETGKIVVSEVSFDNRETIYQLGKHHSAAPPSLDKLPFPVSHSKHFGFPVPGWASSYREIRIQKTIDQGSHMLMWGETIYEEYLKPPEPGFYHIHFLLYLHQHRKGRNYELVG
jgi:flavin reductase (DIM6/NTAB) family NADH-FMN oxidoreductase RutF